MSRIRDLPLVDAWVRDDASFADAAAALFDARVPAIAVVTGERAVVGALTERDVLGALFPGYLAELRHTSFLPDDPTALDERRRDAARRPVTGFLRRAELLGADDSETHAAERFMHTGEPALPVVEDGRFIGMLSIAALCRGRAGDDTAG